MSYNGVGLKTARGSATSGHIQKSKADVNRPLLGAYESRRLNAENAEKSEQRFRRENLSDRHVDEGILEHERKREIEVKCIELQDKLEDEGVDEGTVQDRVEMLRKELTDKKWGNNDKKQFKGYEIHSMAKQKAIENERMKNAFVRSNKVPPWKRGKRNNNSGNNNHGRDYRQREDNYRDGKRSRGRSKSPESDRSRSSSRTPPRRRNLNQHTRERSKSRSKSPSPTRSDPRSPSQSRSPPRRREHEDEPRSRSKTPDKKEDPRSRRQLKAYE